MVGKNVRLKWAGPARQRGVAAVFAGIAMVALLAAVALVIDIGRLYSAQATLQKQANMAALDAARVVARCDANTTPTQADVEQRVSESLARNGISDPALVDSFTDVGTVVRKPDSAHRVLQLASVDEADAVRVSLRRTAPASIFPRPDDDSRLLRASATARQSALGSFFLGTGILSLDGGLLNQTLGGLLCPTGDTACQSNIIALDVASARSGLLDTEVSTGQLGVALGASVQDLSDPLELSLLSPLLPEVLDGLASALSATASATVVDLLQALAANAGDFQVPVDALFDGFDASVPDAPVVNLADLLVALAQASRADSDGVSPIELPLGLSIPGVADVGTFIKILEPPRFSGMGRPGEAMARSAQITIGVRIDAAALLLDILSSLEGLINGIINGLLGLLVGGNVVTVDVADELKIGIDIAVAQSEAFLDELTCPRNDTNDGQPIARLSASPALADVQVSRFDGSALAAPPLDTTPQSRFDLARIDIDANCILILLCLGETSLDVDLELTHLSVGGSETPQPLPLDVTEFERLDTDLSLPAWHPGVWRAHGAPDAPPSSNGSNPQTVQAPTSIFLQLGLDVSETGSGLLGALSGLVADILNLLLTLVQSLLDLVNTLTAAVIDPLLDLLGIRTGTAEVTMNTVSAGQPVLISTEVPVLPDPGP